MTKALLVALILALPVAAAAEGVVIKQSTCSIAWAAPQTSTNGTNLADLKEYGVYIGTTRTLTGPPVVVPAATPDPVAGLTVVFPCSTLSPGQYFVQVDAVDTSGNRSGRSAVVPFVSTDDVPPSAPGDPVVTGP